MTGIGFSMGLGGESARRESRGPLFDAMEDRRCVSAVQDGRTLILAPHIVYRKEGDLRLDAVVVEEDGAPGAAGLTSFDLDSFDDIASTTREFEPLADFEPEDEEAGEILCIVAT